VWGACGRFGKQSGHWKTAVVDALTGEVERILDRPTGGYIFDGPRKSRQGCPISPRLDVAGGAPSLHDPDRPDVFTTAGSPLPPLGV
jgi:hypothetical protein